MEPQPSNGVTKYIIGLVFIVILLGIIFMAGKRNVPNENSSIQNTGEVIINTNIPSQETSGSATTTEMTAGAMVEVDYTDANGFNPNAVAIKIGDTVKFVNKSSEKMWVASNDHPTHTLYSGTALREHCPDTSGTAFDQCGSGDEYSFTFERAGSWHYHNHTRASMQGSITVK